jgi:hypothetical protein
MIVVFKTGRSLVGPIATQKPFGRPLWQLKKGCHYV